jgi:hypothetical protein
VSRALTRQLSLHTAEQRSQYSAGSRFLDFLEVDIIVSFARNVSTIINISTNVEMSKADGCDPANTW